MVEFGVVVVEVVGVVVVVVAGVALVMVEMVGILVVKVVLVVAVVVVTVVGVGLWAASVVVFVCSVVAGGWFGWVVADLVAVVLLSLSVGTVPFFFLNLLRARFSIVATFACRVASSFALLS